MKATNLGIIFSIIAHGLLGISLYAFERISSGRQKSFKLDISFVYDYVPKGNSLDEALLNEEQLKKTRDKKDKTISPAKSHSRNNDTGEKRYGVKNGDEGADSIYIKENLAAIQARIRNMINYPAIARRMGWAGKVFISFLLNTEGKVLNVKIAKSSGYPVLDKCAVKAVLSLSGLPKPPSLTRVEVPFAFSFK